MGKKSSAVHLGLTSAIALSIAGCSTHPTLEAKRCVDQNGKVVDQRYCQGSPSSGYYPYRWYYGGGGGYYPGNGGFRSGPSASPGDTSRGGFGSTGEGHGGSGGE